MHGLLLGAGLLLLSLASLSGFALAKSGFTAEQIARWKVVHAGGSGGGVQLLALYAVWDVLPSGNTTTAVAILITIATWMFFIGPLLKALGYLRVGHSINLIGSAFAVPGYVALPALLLL